MSIDIEEIGKQLKSTLNTDVAIIDKYGFIFAHETQIPRFKFEFVEPGLGRLVN